MANSALKNSVGGLTLPNFKTYYKDTIMKIEWYWQKNRKQINGIVESSEIYPHKYNQLTFKKQTKATQ